MEELLKKVDKLLMELAEIGDIVITLREENKKLKSEIDRQKKEIERLIKEKRLIREKISSLINKIEELEDRILKSGYE